MKKHMTVLFAALILLLSALVMIALLKKHKREDGGRVISSTKIDSLARTAAKKNISQRPSGPADLKNIPPEQLVEPRDGAVEITLGPDDKPTVDAKGNPLLK